jgi:hypothetical protein
MGKPCRMYGSVEKSLKKFWLVNVTEDTTQKHWVAVLNPLKGKVDLINKRT